MALTICTNFLGAIYGQLEQLVFFCILFKWLSPESVKLHSQPHWLIGKEGTKKDLASEQAAVVRQLKEFDGRDTDVQWVFHVIDERYVHISKFYSAFINCYFYSSVQILWTGFQDTNLMEWDVDIHFLKLFFDNLLTEVHLHL